MSTKIAIIGGGNLGTAIAQGLIKSKFSKPADVVVTKRNVDSAAAIKKLGITVTADNVTAVKQSDVIILAVKPFQVQAVLQEFKAFLKQPKVLISVVTGVSVNDIDEVLGKNKIAVFRAMPNTAIAIQESITCICCNRATSEQNKLVNDLFATLGKIVNIDEKLMDAATVLGACGTAYAMRYIRANIQGGIEIGFDAATASLIAAQTVKGAAELLLKNGNHPEYEIDKVTTPKGCTIAGLNEMEHQGFSSSLIRGVVASYKKITNDM